MKYKKKINTKNGIFCGKNVPKSRDFFKIISIFSKLIGLRKCFFFTIELKIFLALVFEMLSEMLDQVKNFKTNSVKMFNFGRYI